MPPRGLRWTILLAIVVQGAGLFRSSLPAQDGLKFIRVAREMQRQPWLDVLRSSDQHPLYPAAIAASQPLVARGVGKGPDSWRIAAQGVSIVATILTLLPLFALTRGLFDESAATLACGLWTVLPLPARIGHETLSDPLALLLFTTTLHFALKTWRSPRHRDAALAGASAGLGYWARPEVVVVALVALMMSGLRWIDGRIRSGPRVAATGPAPATVLGLVMLAGVALYAIAKGELSEKLALRRAVGVASKHDRVRPTPSDHGPIADHFRVSLAPKEEAAQPPHRGLGVALLMTVRGWAEAMGWLLAPVAIGAALFVEARAGRGLVGVYAVIFGAILVRHAGSQGYLSDRHALSLAIATLPWAAVGLRAIGQRLLARFRPQAVSREALRWAAMGTLVLGGVMAQVRPAHASRAGHREAGQWLARNARPEDAVLDTRGWAAFLSDRRSYDAWHVRQAMTDSRLAYIVIGADELAAPSQRGATWRALLAHAATPLATFPRSPASNGDRVHLYRFVRPESWEGVAP